LNLVDVLDDMFRLARDHWRAYAIGLGVVVVPLALLSNLFIALTVGTPPGFVEMLQNPELAAEFGTATTPAELLGFAGASLLSGLVGLLLTPLIYGAGAHIAAVGYRTGRVDPMGSFTTAAGRYGALLGTSVLQWLVPVVIFLVPAILLVLGGIAGVDALAVIGGLGFIPSAIWAIFVLIRIALAIPAVMVERLGPVEALRRSNTLVKGKTGMVFLTFLVIYIITTIIGIVLSLPFNAVGGGVGNAVGAVANTIGQMLASLVNYSLLADELGPREPPSR
jgi:MFS family permease